MGLSNGELSAADVAAVVGNAGNGGFGGWGDGSFWIIVLFLFALMGNGFGNFGGGNGNAPYLVQSGFDQAAIMSGINSLTASQCAGFSGIEASANARQIADMQQNFATQTAITQGMNTIAMNLQNCCCENRANIADLKYTVATENCADRQVVSDGIRDLLANQSANTQRILDQMCQDKIDAKNEEIANLRTQINLANLAASQNAQTAAIIANNEAQTTALEQYLQPVPRPAYIVASPYCCNQGYSYGCGCGSN